MGKVVVVDNGTGYVKAGFAGTNFPEAVFPSLVGRPELRAEMESLENVVLRDIMVGDDAAEVRFALKLSHPVENGIVKNWEDMEHVFDYTFEKKLGLRSMSDHKVMLTEAVLNPTANRRKMLELIFEKYGVKAAQVSVQAVLVLYAQGLLTGVVVDSGDGVTHAVPVYEGYTPAHLVRRLNVAGRHMTAYLAKLMLLRGYSFSREADFETVREIKEKLAYVAFDVSRERALALETTVLVEEFELPDGSTVKVGRERFECAEALFNPSLVDSESLGMADMIFEMIQAAEVDMRDALYKHIVLSGGSSMFPGLPSRLEHDIRARYLKDVLRGDTSRLNRLKLRIEDPPRRKHHVFLGASVLGDLMANRDEFWASKREYQELGVDKIMAKMSK